MRTSVIFHRACRCFDSKSQCFYRDCVHVGWLLSARGNQQINWQTLSAVQRLQFNR